MKNRKRLYLPDDIIIDTLLKGHGLLDTCDLCLKALSSADFPEIDKWAIPSETALRTDSIEDYLRSLSKEEATTVTNASIDLLDGSLIGLFRVEEDLWSFQIYIKVDKSNLPGIVRNFRLATVFCRELLQKGDLLKGTLGRQGGAADFIPEVPVAGYKTHLIVTTREEVEENYDNPDVFFQAGWSTVEQYGDKYLLLRAMDAPDSVAFASQVMPHQWIMARNAKAGLTKYYTPKPKPEEMNIYKSGRQYLEVVGYLPEEKLIELSCYIPPDEHVAGWEIYDIANLVRTRSLADGRKVETVRVVFYSREMAEQEKRPLLDVGAKIFYEDSSGELVEITL